VGQGYAVCGKDEKLANANLFPATKLKPVPESTI
tara:strand:+ start:477 stop:578 length:102 start_codon:yes stop_codon:yes gene_type:complete